MKSCKEQWACISGCGACCRLAPEERSEAIQALNDDDLRTYISMVGEDGWCVNYDKGSRKCMIYKTRPSFCRISSLPSLFKIGSDDLDTFYIKCCRQQIRFTYSGRSLVMRRFNRQLRKKSKKNG